LLKRYWAICTFLLLAVAPAYTQGVRQAQATYAEYETRLVALVNQDRARHGLRPLQMEQSLTQAGRIHSRDMARLGFFDHVSPDRNKRTPSDRWRQVIQRLPDAFILAENLFYGSRTDVRRAHQALMNSPGHRKNILGREYSKIGVGIHVANGDMWVTQMFLGDN
jgi:uncharacterized protein YkwD